MMTTTKYHTKSGSVYTVKRDADNIQVMREKLGDKHQGARREHRETADKLGEFRRAADVMAYGGGPPTIGARLSIVFRTDYDDGDLVTSHVTAIVEEI